MDRNVYGVDVSELVRWCFRRLEAGISEVTVRVISSSRYTVALALQYRRRRYVCKFSSSAFSARVPTVHRLLMRAGTPAVPRVFAFDLIGDGSISLQEYVSMAAQPSVCYDVLPALGAVQRRVSECLDELPAEMSFGADEVTHELAWLREEEGAAAAGPYSSRLVRWAGLSVTGLRKISLGRFVDNWQPRVVEWSCLLAESDARSTIDHADLSLDNTGVSTRESPNSLDSRRCVLFDWEDARLGSPFLSLDKLVAEHGLEPSSEAVRTYARRLGVRPQHAGRLCVAGAALGALRDWQRIRLNLVRTGRPHLRHAYATAWAARTAQRWQRLIELGWR